MNNKEFRVLFVYPNPRKMSLVPGSIALFTALLKKDGVNVDLFDTSLYRQDHLEDADELAEKYLHVKPTIDSFKQKVKLKTENVIDSFQAKVDDFKPDLIAATCVESTFTYTITLLESIRDKKILTILGGVFATSSPEYALTYDEIDIVCRGDGEKAIIELVRRLRSGEDYAGISNLYIKKDSGIIKNKMTPPVPLDELPLGDFRIFNEQRLYRAMGGKIYKMAPIETHRGCTNICTFCNSPLQNTLYKDETDSRYFRSKSISNVYEEIKYFVDEFNVQYLFFWADNFFAYPLKTIEEFCKMYREFRLPFYCQTYPTTLKEDKLKMLIEVGLHRVGVGIEHGNEEFRRKVLKRTYANEDAVRRLRLLGKYGIEFSTNNIIGFPDETPELADDTIKLNREIGATMSSCSVFTPFRGTYLRQVSIEKGYLKDRDILAPSNDVMTVLEMPQFTREQIEGKRRTFELYIRLPESRWKDIALAEQLTPEGDEALENLTTEYKALRS